MTIGDRLREERERLGFSQPAFAALAETTKKSQIDYEKDFTQPKAGYLAAVAKVGADVQYIVTGQRSASNLPADEAMLLDRYRASTSALKDAALRVLLGGGEATASRYSFNKMAETVQEQVVGDVVYNESVTFNSDRKNKR